MKGEVHALALMHLENYMMMLVCKLQPNKEKVGYHQQIPFLRYAVIDSHSETECGVNSEQCGNYQREDRKISACPHDLNVLVEVYLLQKPYHQPEEHNYRCKRQVQLH